MTSERWQQVKELCERLLELTPGERHGHLVQFCPDDPELREQVEELIALATGSDGQVPPGIWAQLGPHSFSASSRAFPALGSFSVSRDSLLGTFIGRYRILRLIGEGGMGAVYEAEQEQPRRPVALKLIRPGLTSPEILHRFQREWEALGRLQHRGIARVYEAGTAETLLGLQPFIAMELIDGQTLTAYARSRELALRERLQLVASVCDAIQHAHERGLIHRDLKPANILIDRDGHPRVLDFGVARLVSDDRQPTIQTNVGQLVGTLAYMSPEQALGDSAEVDTRSDVYALGLILYELLAGRLPFTLSSLVHEAVHTIRNEDPPPLSAIDRTCRGDIDVIVGKALEKDKARRYASAAALADDIRRYLSHEPIAARPASAIYQLTRFARRHTAVVVGSAAVIVALAAGTVVSTWMALRAREAQRQAVDAERRASSERDEANRERNRAVVADAESRQQRDQAIAERQRADRESETAAAVSNFLRRDLLAQAGASAQAVANTTPDPNLTVRTTLDRAARRIGTTFAQGPAVEAAIRQTIGDAYLDLGLFTPAQEQLEQALTLRQRTVGEHDPATLEVISSLGKVLVAAGKYADAARRQREVVAALREQRGEDDPDTLAAMTNLSAVLQHQGRYAEAAALLRTATQALRRVRGANHPDTLGAMSNLAEQYRLQGNYPAATKQYAEAVRGYERVLGRDHPDTWRAMNGLALGHVGLGNPVEAEQVYRDILDRQRRILGSNHADTLSTMNNLALMLTGLGRYRDADPLTLEVLSTRRRVFGNDHPDTLLSLNNAGNLLMEEGRYAEAEPLLQEAIAGRRRLLGPEHPNTLNAMANMSQTYFRQARWMEAEALLNDVLSVRRRVLGADHPSTALAMNQLSALYTRLGRLDEAAAMLDAARQVWTRVLGPDHGQVWRTDCLRGALLLRKGAFESARVALNAAVDGSARVLGDAHVDTLRCRVDLARASQWASATDSTEAMLGRTLERLRQLLGDRHPDTLAAAAVLGELYLRTGRLDDAEPLLRQATLGRREVLGAAHPETLESTALAGWLYVAQHRADDASRMAASLESQPVTPVARWYRYQGQALRGAALAGSGATDDVESLLVRGYEGMRESPPTLSAIDRQALDRVADALAALYQAAGQLERADEWRARMNVGNRLP